MSKTIGIFVGSLRKGSYTRAVASAAAAMLPAGYEAAFVELGELAMFNQDFDDEGTTPAAWTRFREQVKGLDACLFFTPEYNRSYPAVLKNALDIASRPAGQSVWGGKPAALISVSPGKMGGFGSNQHLRQTMSFLELYLMPQPEAYFAGIDKLLDDNGKLADERTLAFLQKIIDAFIAWTNKF